MDDIFHDPFKHVGPPPNHLARSGRMNAEGISVLYCALDKDTCLAEMRPALGNQLAVIALKTTKPLRILDFSRLQAARGGNALRYLQPDFTEEVEKGAFLRRLHSLVSQPIVPGHEADYLITQTMAEYLAHVHGHPFDGILFASAQKAGGSNLVLFADAQQLEPSAADAFGIEYLIGSVKLFETRSVEYTHHELHTFVRDDGRSFIVHNGYDEDPESFD